MDTQIKDKIFKGLIWSFLILYLSVALISGYHCVEFCMVGNPLILSIIMSFAFEVGLALTLFSILISDKNKNNTVNWILMSLLTCVQVMGNIYSVEKYMETSNNNFYVYIQNGFLHWFTEDMPEKEVMSIIAIILGALLPFVALLMTSMVARNWKDHMEEKRIEKQQTEETEQIPFPTEPPIEKQPSEPITTEEEEAVNQIYNDRENESSVSDTPSTQHDEKLVESLLNDDDKKREFVTVNESPTKSKETPIPQENSESEETETSSEETTEEVKFATPKPQQTTEFKKPVINFFSPISQRK